MRNAVKATIDAYDGTTTLYVFAPDDPIIRAYRNLFPSFVSSGFARCRPTLRAHARYPETLFRAQAEIYRTYHMLDPQSFYNKEDVWDLARFVHGQNGEREPMTPDLRGGYVARARTGRNSCCCCRSRRAPKTT